MEELLALLGGMRLRSSVFAEAADDLARAIEVRWAQHAVPHARIAKDVWDLLRGERAPLERWAQELPSGCLVIIIGGPPCNQMTWAGPSGGVLGLCGKDSVLFYVIPVAGWALQRARPDVYVHAVVDNAGSMRKLHRDGVVDALGIQARQCQRISSDGWSHAGLRWDGQRVSVLRSRGGEGDLRASTRHYHPLRLLYHHGSHWHFGTGADVASRMRQLLRQRERQGLDVILAGDERRREDAALAFVRWVERD